MALYQTGHPHFRMASKPAAEARLWMFEGFAGGIQPWWHHVGAYHEDRRMYQPRTTASLAQDQTRLYLVNRRPIATVAIGWSQRNTDFYGRDQAEELVDLPYQGFMQALIRARIPYLPVHLDHIERDNAEFTLLILPNVAAMSDEQCDGVRRFVDRGGSLIASGVTSLYDPHGDARKDFALGELFKTHLAGTPVTSCDRGERNWSVA